MQITMFTANCVGQAGNCSYPNRAPVSTAEQLQSAARSDHFCAEYKGNYRSIGNFIRSDVIVMDIDNDHTEEPDDWITPEKMDEEFSDFSYAPSTPKRAAMFSCACGVHSYRGIANSFS